MRPDYEGGVEEQDVQSTRITQGNIIPSSPVSLSPTRRGFLPDGALSQPSKNKHIESSIRHEAVKG